MKKGVLVMAYGSPEKAADIAPYYTDIRRGIPPSAAQLEELIGRYNAIGGSPLLRITASQASKIQNELDGDYKVYLGMRHWNPWILDAVKKMKDDGIEEAVGIVMAPHFSSMSIKKYIEKVEEAKRQLQYNIEFQYIENWHDQPLFIEALHEKIVEALSLFSEDEKKGLHIIFTAHSLPEKILENKDPYKDQLLETCELLAKKDHIKHWSFAFQSAGRTQEKWLGPDLLHEIDRLHKKGVKSILVCSVGFITDHLEVLYDIDIEGKKHAKSLGIHLERTKSLNDNPLMAKLLAELTKNKLK